MKKFLRAVCVVLAILVVFRWRELRRLRSHLPGMWTGDPSFLKTAELSDMQLFIAPDLEKGYCIMADNGGKTIANTPFDLKVKSKFFGRTSDKKCTFFAELEFEKAPMPGELSMALSVADGTLTLYSDEKVYAFLHKDHAASQSARLEWEKLEQLDSDG